MGSPGAGGAAPRPARRRPDGALIRTRRRTGKTNRKNYSGKHESHGLLFLALTDERGNPCHARILTSTFKLAAAPWALLTGWRRLPYRACVHEYR
ncbi:hypothetical protein [Streptomyces hygroscopicus]|uniref:hypothetical protein n=1 Tax=Streptomyces hygroscopicus TaxID=1912 RepID=UPI00099D9947|nr:hypothetical protein [Streptomyces hygroscopicus]